MLLFRDPGLLKEVGDRSVALFSLPAQEILQGMSKNPTFDFKEFEHLFPEETVDILNQLALKADVEQWEEEQDQGETLLEFQKCLGELLKLDLKEKLDKIAKEIKLAEELRDGERVKTLMEEFQRLSETFHLSH